MDSTALNVVSVAAAVVSAVAAVWVGIRHGALQRKAGELQARVVALEEGRELPRLTPDACRNAVVGDTRVVTIGLHNSGASDAVHFELKRALVAVVSANEDTVHQIVSLDAQEAPAARSSIPAGKSASFKLKPIAADKLRIVRGRKTVVTRIEGTYVRVIDASGSTEDRTYIYEAAHLEREYGFPDIATWRDRGQPGGVQGFFDAMK